MRAALCVVMMFACGSGAPPPVTPSHATSMPSTVATAPATTTTGSGSSGQVDPDVPTDDAPCARYDAMIERVQTCTGIDTAERERLLQIHIDTQAAISENGLDDSFVDPDTECEEGIASVQKAAAVCLR